MGVSVDPLQHNSDMIGKLMLPFPLLSDARGELAKLYGLWNEEEGVAVPAIVVVDRTGEIRYLYEGGDFADRPGDEEVFAALDNLDSDASGYVGEEVAVRLDGTGAADSVRPDRPPIPLDQLVPYYRGAFFTTRALERRLAREKGALEEVGRYQSMVRKFQQNIEETRRMKRESEAQA